MKSAERRKKRLTIAHEVELLMELEG